MLPKERNVAKPRIAVIGAGVGGIMFGIALRKQLPGFEDFIIYEKANDVGGTWRDNTYPGCSSDVHIHFYSHSSNLNPDWNNSHGFQPDIQQYWKDLTARYNLYPHIDFGTLVTSAEWDTNHKSYTVPKIPELSGLSSFNGQSFHSAIWDHAVDLRGKRVAVIGNGASATQLVPRITEDPSVQVTEFCKTPNWFVPPSRSPYSSVHKWVFKHVPLVMRLFRNSIFLRGEALYFFIFSGNKFLHRLCTKILWRYISTTAPEKYLKDLRPDYALGCRRIIFNCGYLEALHRPNLVLNWNGIEAIVEDGIITSMGEKLPFDVMIFAAGFVTNDYPLHVRGTSQTVQEYYDKQGSPSAYVGTTVPGFPNFFMLSGPNTTTGHTSVIYSEEVQVDYIMKFVKPIVKGLVTSAVVTDAATDAYNQKLDARLATSVFVGCQSWYRKDGDGRVSSIFPGAGSLFWWWLRSVDWTHYNVEATDEWHQRFKSCEKARLLSITAFFSLVITAAVLAIK